jgi:hypothetical protein
MRQLQPWQAVRQVRQGQHGQPMGRGRSSQDISRWTEGYALTLSRPVGSQRLIKA